MDSRSSPSEFLPSSVPHSDEETPIDPVDILREHGIDPSGEQARANQPDHAIVDQEEFHASIPMPPDGVVVKATGQCSVERKTERELFENRADKFIKRWLGESFKSEVLAEDDNYKVLRNSVYRIVLSTDERILKSVMEGDLPIQYSREIEDNGLKRALDRNGEFGLRAATNGKTPIIYANYLIDDDGQGLPYRSTRKLIRKLKRYVDDEDFAYGIDRQIAPHAHGDNTYRRYLCDQYGRDIPDRYQQLEKFIDQLTYRCEFELETAMQTDRMLPLSEIGYTASGKDRRNAHLKHSASNYLMNLTEAVCVSIWGPRSFRIRFFVIFVIPQPNLASLAELFFTSVSHATTSDGGGFSHEPAGRSVNSSTTITPSRTKELHQWCEDNIAWANHETYLFAGLREEICRNLERLAAVRASRRQHIERYLELIDFLPTEIEYLRNCEKYLEEKQAEWDEIVKAHFGSDNSESSPQIKEEE